MIVKPSGYQHDNNIKEDNSDDEFSKSGVLTAVGSAVKSHKKKIKRSTAIPGYKDTELGPRLKPEQKRVDYVLVYNKKCSKDEEYPHTVRSLLKKENKRKRFENAMKREGFVLQETTTRNNVFVKIHCPFKRLCAEAEMVKLEMPLKGCDKEEPNMGCLGSLIEKYFETDSSVDFVSAPFIMDRIQLYEGYEDPTNFFRSSTRSMLVHHILMNLDIRNEDDKERKILQIRGLQYLLMRGVYTDAFPLHDKSSLSSFKEENVKGNTDSDGKTTDDEDSHCVDPRRDLDETWSRWFKFQPLWKIRNYFGEKIALYFAWTGMLTLTLWFPTILGISIFLYGFVESLVNGSDSLPRPNNSTDYEIVQWKMDEMLSSIRHAFDNRATPYFALIICLWGTVFLELWKRTNATLAYEWDVDNFEINEPDRPQFYGLKVKKDPITREEHWIYPFRRHILKFTGSTIIVCFMIFIVGCVVYGVIVYRVRATVRWCPRVGSVGCFFLTTILSSVVNGLIILILGKLYDWLALVLTKWENHRTQSGFDDALIIKMFAFQFANTYASCFYIAFLRGRIDIKFSGDYYSDICSKTCMSQLTFQVMVLMLIKPIPKFLKDISVPAARRLWRIRRNWCCRFRCCQCCRCCQNKVDDEETIADNHETDMNVHFDYVEKERLKPVLGDFTLGEYSEKVLQYGFLMLFASAFPLAPLLALLTNAIDIRIDCKRLLWMYRRPVAEIRGDIGKWYGILQFLNMSGVITNSFIIAFTSSWAEKYTTTEKLWFVIGFEHIVFTLKFLLAYLIPDVPSSVALDIRKEKFQVAKLLGSSAVTGGYNLVDYSQLVPEHNQNKRRQRSANYDNCDEKDDESVSKNSVDVSEHEKYQNVPLNGSFYTAISVSGIQPKSVDGKTQDFEV